MGMVTTRRIIRNSWTGTMAFEPWRFHLRLERAKKVRKTYEFELLAAAVVKSWQLWPRLFGIIRTGCSD